MVHFINILLVPRIPERVYSKFSVTDDTLFPHGNLHSWGASTIPDGEALIENIKDPYHHTRYRHIALEQLLLRRSTHLHR